jgi:hypothetical protein
VIHRRLSGKEENLSFPILQSGAIVDLRNRDQRHRQPATVSTTSDLFTYDLPLDFFSTLPAKVDKVADSDVERIATQYFVPEHMFVVVIGDRQKIETGLQGLNLGKIHLTSFEGTPAPAADKPAGDRN